MAIEMWMRLRTTAPVSVQLLLAAMLAIAQRGIGSRAGLAT